MPWVLEKFLEKSGNTHGTFGLQSFILFCFHPHNFLQKEKTQLKPCHWKAVFRLHSTKLRKSAETKFKQATQNLIKFTNSEHKYYIYTSISYKKVKLIYIASHYKLVKLLFCTRLGRISLLSPVYIQQTLESRGKRLWIYIYRYQKRQYRRINNDWVFLISIA